MGEHKIQQTNSILWAATIALNFFWVLNILKEAFSGVKSFLNFYPPVGPLLGLFIFSVIIFFISILILVMIKPKSQKVAFWVYVTSILVFFLMVFPPVWEPIVDILAGK